MVCLPIFATIPSRHIWPQADRATFTLSLCQRGYFPLENLRPQRDTSGRTIRRRWSCSTSFIWHWA